MKRWMATPVGAWRAVVSKPLLFGANLLGLPILLAAVWAWLYIPVSNVPLVLLSVGLMLIVVLALLLLTAYTYNCYYVTHHSMRPISSEGIHLPTMPVVRRTISALPWLAAWFVVFGFLCLSISWVSGLTLEWAKPVASWITMASQKPVSFYSVNAVFETILQLIRWLVLPLVFFASFAGFATAALRKGRKRSWQWHALGMLRSPHYWLAWLAFAVVGVWLPAKLVSWVPPLDGIALATGSMLLRFGLALAIAVLCWLVFLSVLARLTKQSSQSVIVLPRQPHSRPA